MGGRTVKQRIARPSIREVPYQYRSSSNTPISENSRHSTAVISLRNALELHFKDRPDVFLSGRLSIWREDGKEDVERPDVIVTLGVWPGERDSYYLWVEGKAPDFVFDVVSSAGELTRCYVSEWYLELGVREYVVYDPGYDGDVSKIRMFRRRGNRFVEVIPDESGEVQSEVLGLGFRPTGDFVRARDLQNGKDLPSLLELDQALSEEREARLAEARARQEAEGRVAELERILKDSSQTMESRK